MTKIDKALAKMRNNPKDWNIEDLKNIAKRFNVEFRQPGTSHVTFRASDGSKVTVPAHKPIKPIYIKLFLTLIDQIGDKNE